MKKDEIIAFLQQLVESQKLQLESQKHLVESQNRQIDALLRQVASLTDEVASLKVLLVQKGEEEEKTKRALKVLGKLNRNKSEKQTPPAQETETPGNNNNAETEGSHSQADKLHLPSGPQAQYRTGRVDRGQAQEMEGGHVQADNENHKEKARPDGSRQDDTAKDGEI